MVLLKRRVIVRSSTDAQRENDAGLKGGGDVSRILSPTFGLDGGVVFSDPVVAGRVSAAIAETVLLKLRAIVRTSVDTLRENDTGLKGGGDVSRIRTPTFGLDGGVVFSDRVVAGRVSAAIAAPPAM